MFPGYVTSALCARYLKAIHHSPFLSEQEEKDLIGRWQTERDEDAMNALIKAHLRLSLKISSNFFKNSGLPLADLLSEANLGLLKALESFDPTRMVRFSTYAAFWVRAHVQAYVMKNWSMVRASRAKRGAAPDLSLNLPLGDEESGSREWQDLLEDERHNPEDVSIVEDADGKRRRMIARALKNLPKEEQYILKKRYLNAHPASTEEIAKKLKLDGRRVYRMERSALKKLRQHLLKHEAPYATVGNLL